MLHRNNARSRLLRRTGQPAPSHVAEQLVLPNVSLFKHLQMKKYLGHLLTQGSSSNDEISQRDEAISWFALYFPPSSPRLWQSKNWI